MLYRRQKSMSVCTLEASTSIKRAPPVKRRQFPQLVVSKQQGVEDVVTNVTNMKHDVMYIPVRPCHRHQLPRLTPSLRSTMNTFSRLSTISVSDIQAVRDREKGIQNGQQNSVWSDYRRHSNKRGHDTLSPLYSAIPEGEYSEEDEETDLTCSWNIGNGNHVCILGKHKEIFIFVRIYIELCCIS